MAEVEAGDKAGGGQMEIEDNVVDTNPATHLKEVSDQRYHLLAIHGLA